MKNLMIILSIIMSAFVSTAVFAHTDHHLGEGSLHEIYHAVFWLVLLVVAYKGICWFNAKHKTKS